MNLILIPQPTDLIEFSAGDPRFEHARGVLRIREGDSFYVGVINGPMGLAWVQTVAENRLTASVSWNAQAQREHFPIVLWVGLSRPQTMKKVLLEAATWGVSEVNVVAAGKSDPAYARSSLWLNNEFQKSVNEGLEQGFHTCAPKVVLYPQWPPFEQRTAIAGELRLALDLYETSASLGAKLRSAPVARRVHIAIGPERGWNKADRNALRERQFDALSLGPTVLRVESAVTAALALCVDRLEQ